MLSNSLQRHHGALPKVRRVVQRLDRAHQLLVLVVALRLAKSTAGLSASSAMSRVCGEVNPTMT